MPGTIPLMLPPGKHSSDLGGWGVPVLIISLLTHTHADATPSSSHTYTFSLSFFLRPILTQNAFCLCLDIQWPLSATFITITETS